jgi:2',3'-cyclic-nucleotide 2'-phosphodiesterase (5'-nucleotidase family)
VNEDMRGGASRVSHYVQTLRSKMKYPKNLLVLSAGDMLSPSLMSTLFYGKQMIQANNMIGLNYSAFGNHEFDFGLDILHQRLNESNFTWINSNIGLPFATTENIVVNVGPVKVGLFGVLYNFGPVDKNIVIHDVMDAAKVQVSKLKQAGAQFIIALTHQVAPDDCKLTYLPGIDLIIGGHDHRMKSNHDCGFCSYVKATQDWQDIWHLTVNFNFSTPVITYTSIPITGDMPTDPEMENLISLEGTEHVLRTQESNLADYIVDKLRQFTQTDIAFLNAGSIRGNKYYPAGPITKGTIMGILPFLNYATILSINGTVLKQALENGVSQVELISGRFPAPSGFKLEFSLQRPVGDRVILMQYKNASGVYVDIEPDQEFTMATSDFLYSGGDQYYMFQSLPRLSDPDNEQVLSVIVMDAIREEETISPTVDGRIVQLNELALSHSF